MKKKNIFQPLSLVPGEDVLEEFGFGAIVETLMESHGDDGIIPAGSRGVLLGVDDDPIFVRIDFAGGLGEDVVEVGLSGLRKI